MSGINQGVEVYDNYFNVPRNMIVQEIEGLYGSKVLKELGEIIGYYNVYEKGAKFVSEGSKGDYVPADLRIKQTASLINKEARFMFSKSPDIWVEPEFSPGDKASAQKAKDDASIMQSYVDKVFNKTRFFSNLLKGAKDCFIGKRIAVFVNFNEETQKVHINFCPSLEFVYETDLNDIDVLTKVVCFFTTVDDNIKTKQRIYKKKYWMENGKCWIEEGLYDGTGTLIEEITPARATKFTYIPAVIIRNDGLTGDTDGTSEVANLQDNEAWYSRLSSADIDAERQSMNPIRYSIDMDASSTKGLSTAAGSFWDLSSDQNLNTSAPSVGVLETTMNYSAPLTNTLNRIKNAAYTELDMPDTSPEALQGVVSSGKTLKALYWGLTVRCDEKMQEWRPAIEQIVRILIDGAHLYPKSVVNYTTDTIPDVPYSVRVDNQYSLPEDETEEKQIDLSEVSAQTMSRKSYMKKWRNLTDDEADEELKQIALERELLEDSYSSDMFGTGKQTEEQPIEVETEEV